MSGPRSRLVRRLAAGLACVAFVGAAAVTGAAGSATLAAGSTTPSAGADGATIVGMTTVTPYDWWV